jgi:cytochrome oxidase Cu insertion factor (SCO1/SenC/PrrC family)
MSEQPLVESPVKKKSMWQLWLLIAIFALPPVAAYVVYFAGWMPDMTTNKGVLIQPVEPFPELSLQTLEGGELDRTVLDRQWVMLTFTDAACDEPCQTRVHDLRQIWKALAEGRKHVERMLVVGRQQEDDFADFLKDYEGMHVAVASGESYSKLLMSLSKSGEAEPGAVFLVDPMGNLMMRYLPQQPAKDILADMDHLLSVSQFHK